MARYSAMYLVKSICFGYFVISTQEYIYWRGVPGTQEYIYIYFKLGYMIKV